MRAVVVLLLLATASAAAQPAANVQPREPTPQPHKSELFAGSLSFGLTAAGFTTLLVTYSLAQPDQTGRRLRSEYKMPLYLTSGLLLAVGPTTGHIYAGKIWNRGLAVRAVSGAIMAIAVSAADDCCGEADHNGNETAAGIAVAAGLVFLGASIYECVDAPRAVRRYNQRASIAIAPLLSREPGLAIVGRF